MQKEIQITQNEMPQCTAEPAPTGMPNEGLCIRDARETDLAAIETIECACFSLPWTAEQLRTYLSGRHVLLTAEADGKVCGYIGLLYILDEGYIANVAVDAAYRRRGIAEKLMRALAARARALGVRFLTLEVRAGNAGAIALYRKLGYEQVGLRKKYYQKPTEDAILMTLEPI